MLLRSDGSTLGGLELSSTPRRELSLDLQSQQPPPSPSPLFSIAIELSPLEALPAGNSGAKLRQALLGRFRTFNFHAGGLCSGSASETRTSPAYLHRLLFSALTIVCSAQNRNGLGVRAVKTLWVERAWDFGNVYFWFPLNEAGLMKDHPILHFSKR